MTRPLCECDDLIVTRAIRLVRIHLAGRKPVTDRAKRSALNERRDRAFELLIDAVEERDRAFLAFQKSMDDWRRRSAAALKGHSNRARREQGEG